MRSEHSLFKIGMFTHKTLNGAVLISVLLVLLVLFTPLKSAFGLVYLTKELYLIAVGLVFVPLIIMEIAKLISYIFKK